jgi:apolipoprotein N-acyltransferase
MPGNLSITALAERLRGLLGWRRRLAALIAGALSALAMAPFFYWPVLWLTLPALVWLIDGAAWRVGDGQRRRWHARPAVAAAETG